LATAIKNTAQLKTRWRFTLILGYDLFSLLKTLQHGVEW
jgi:hypothetical protein